MTGAVVSVGQFLDIVAKSSTSALLLDYDGTLAPFTTDRQHAYPYPFVPGLLKRIKQTGHTRVVLISGRAAHEVKELLGLDPAPEIWGAHGLERLLPSGEYRLAEIPAETSRRLEQAHAMLDREGLCGIAELKPSGIALHWRGREAGAVEKIRAAAQRAWQPLLRHQDLLVREFDGGIELRIRGRDKGDAARTIAAEMGEGAAIAYLGDDLTDEDAFCALAGRGLTILVRSEARETAAALWLKPPEELTDFLTEWLRCVEEKG